MKQSLKEIFTLPTSKEAKKKYSSLEKYKFSILRNRLFLILMGLTGIKSLPHAERLFFDQIGLFIFILIGSYLVGEEFERVLQKMEDLADGPREKHKMAALVEEKHKPPALEDQRKIYLEIAKPFLRALENMRDVIRRMEEASEDELRTGSIKIAFYEELRKVLALKNLLLRRGMERGVTAANGERWLKKLSNDLDKVIRDKDYREDRTNISILITAYDDELSSILSRIEYEHAVHQAQQLQELHDPRIVWEVTSDEHRERAEVLLKLLTDFLDYAYGCQRDLVQDHGDSDHHDWVCAQTRGAHSRGKKKFIVNVFGSVQDGFIGADLPFYSRAIFRINADSTLEEDIQNLHEQIAYLQGLIQTDDRTVRLLGNDEQMGEGLQEDENNAVAAQLSSPNPISP